MASTLSLDELRKAIATLEEALTFADAVKSNSVQFKIARDACIQRFEYCIELSWKVSIKKLGSATKFPKQAVREMARADLIASAETWLDFIEARNNSSHSYDEDIAQKVFAEILSFQKEVKFLYSNLEKLA
ncbi:MAG: HI0074 family nucleotidyltransferase substrate-binding subunit [Bdellovibrio sp.]